MDKLNRMLKSFFWFASLTTNNNAAFSTILSRNNSYVWIHYIYISLHCFRLRQCLSGSRKKLTDYPKLILRFKNDLKGNFMTV